MAYDKKSDIGEFVSRPGDPRSMQVDYYAEKMITLPLQVGNLTTMGLPVGNNTSMGLPVGNATSMQLPIGNNTSMSLPMGNVSSMSLPIGHGTSMQLPISNGTSVSLGIGHGTSMALQGNAFKEIDVLNMEQFGQNTAINRKDQGVELARNCDTYSEYGVIGTENTLNLSSTESVNIVDEYDAKNMRLECATIGIDGAVSDEISVSTTADNMWLLPSIVTKTIIGFNNDGEHISYIGNVQSLHDTSDEAIAYTFINEKNQSNSDCIVDNRGNVTAKYKVSRDPDTGANIESPILQSYTYAKGKHNTITIQLENYSEYNVEMKSGTSSTAINPRSFTSIYMKPPGIDKVFEVYRANYKVCTFTVKSVYDEFIETDRMCVSASSTNSINDSDHFVFRVFYNDESGNPIGNPATAFIIPKYPRYTMFVTKHSHKQSTNVFAYHRDSIVRAYRVGQSNNISLKPIASVSVDGFNNLYDSYCIYNNTRSLGTEIFMIKNGGSYDRITNYNEIVSVSRYFSIGIVNCSNKKFICLRYKKKFNSWYDSNSFLFTAINDIEVISLLSITIVNVGDDNLSFKAVTNTGTRYYSFFHTKNTTTGRIQDEGLDMPVFETVSLKIDNIYLNGQKYFDSIKSFKCKLNTFNSDVYTNRDCNFNIAMSSNRNEQVIVSDYQLSDSVLSIRDLTDYICRSFKFNFLGGFRYRLHRLGSFSKYIKMDTEGNIVKYSCNLVSIPTLDKDTKEFKVLPPKLFDEYPEFEQIPEFNDNIFTVGKSFVSSTNHGLFIQSNYKAMAIRSSQLLTMTGKETVYNLTNTFFVVSYGTTTVYSFSELGMQQLLSLEDSLICTPTKLAAGILMLAKNGIWLLNEQSVRCIFRFEERTERGFIRQNIDTSCVVGILYMNRLCAYYVSQYGSVSVMSVYDSLNPIGIEMHTMNDWIDIPRLANMYDIGNQYNVVLSTSDGRYHYVSNGNRANKFTLESNQVIKAFGDPVVVYVRRLSLFVKRDSEDMIGEIEYSIYDNNGYCTDVISVDHTGYNYKRYEINLDKDIRYDMFKYELKCKNVKMMTRIIALVEVIHTPFG